MNAIAVLKTGTGDYLVGGAQGSDVHTTPWLAVLNPDGERKWLRTYSEIPIGDQNAQFVPARTVLAPETDAYLIGGSAGGIDKRSAMLMAVDATGEPKWATLRPSTAPGEETITGVVETPAGYLYVGTRQQSETEIDCALTGLVDKTGTHIREGRLCTDARNPEPSALTSASNGAVVVGEIQKSDDQVRDAWIVKLDEQGREEWSRTYGGEFNDGALDIVSTPDGGYAIAGYTNSYGNCAPAAWLLKLDDNGDVQWNRTYNKRSGTVARSVQISADGLFYHLAGVTWKGEYYSSERNDAWLALIDTNEGESRWSESYAWGGNTSANSLLVDSDGNLILAGTGGWPPTAVVFQTSIREVEWQWSGANNFISAIRTDPESPRVGEPVVLSAADSGITGAKTYHWTVSGPSMPSPGYLEFTGETVAQMLNKPGEHNVRLEITDGSGGTYTSRQTITVSGAPYINPATIELSRFPVPTGEEPRLSVEVQNADRVSVKSTSEDTTSRVDLEYLGANTWEGYLTSESEPGTRVDLEIVAENDAGETIVDDWGIATDTPILAANSDAVVDPSSHRLGYYVFDGIVNTAVVVGRFADEDREYDAVDLDEWLRTRAIDLNTYFGSSRGSAGATGFSLRGYHNNGALYEVQRRSNYDDPAFFMDDLQNAAAHDVPFEHIDLWVGVHPGGTLGAEQIWWNKNRIYDSLQYINKTWFHEFTHAQGMHHLYDRGNLNWREGNSRWGILAGGHNDQPPPVTTVPRLGKLNSANNETAWLEANVTHLGDVDADDGTIIEVPSLFGYRLGDTAPVVRVSESHKADSEYILEGRPEAGCVLVYKEEQALSRTKINLVAVLREDGDTAEDKFDLLDHQRVSFELESESDEHTCSSAEYVANVCVTPTRNFVDKIVATLEDLTELPGADGSDDKGNADPGLPLPTLDLIAVDDRGRQVGVDETGEYTIEIPGAVASGRRVMGMEWIAVPEEVDVEFFVSNRSAEQFIDAFEDEVTLDDAERRDLRDELTAEYRISVARSDVDAEDDGPSTKVNGGKISPGAEEDSTPRNDISQLDIVAVYPASDRDERVVFENTGAASLDLSGWTLVAADDLTYEFPDAFTLDPNTTVAVHTDDGTETSTDLYWGAEYSVWDPSGDRIAIHDADGDLVLEIWYDVNGAIYYQDGLREELASPSGTGTGTDDDGDESGDSNFEGELPGWAPVVGGAAGISLGIGAYLNHLRKRDKRNEESE